MLLEPRKIGESILYGNIFISVAAASLSIVSLLFFHTSISEHWNMPLLAFSGACSIYSFHAIKSRSSYTENETRQVWINRNGHVLAIIFFGSLLCMGLLLFSLSFYSLLILTFLAIISLLYSIRITVWGKSFRLKEFPYAKPFLIGGVWSIIVVMVPAVELKQLFPATIWFWLQQFLFISALSIPFDLRDEGLDRKNAFRSLPIVLGAGNTKKLALFLLLGSLFLSFLASDFVPALISFVPAAFFILFSGKYKADLYYSLYGDGVMILFSLIFFVVHVAS